VKPVGEPDAGERHVRFDERGWETERCRMAEATAPILDSTSETVTPTLKANTRMTKTVGEVQRVQTSSGQRGFGFILRATDGRWISLCYETQDEAESAKESIEVAVQNAIAVEIDR